MNSGPTGQYMQNLQKAFANAADLINKEFPEQRGSVQASDVSRLLRHIHRTGSLQYDIDQFWNRGRSVLIPSYGDFVGIKSLDDDDEPSSAMNQTAPRAKKPDPNTVEPANKYVSPGGQESG